MVTLVTVKHSTLENEVTEQGWLSPSRILRYVSCAYRADGDVRRKGILSAETVHNRCQREHRSMQTPVENKGKGLTGAKVFVKVREMRVHLQASIVMADENEALQRSAQRGFPGLGRVR